MGDAGPLRVALRERCELGVVLDADRSSAELPGRGDGYTALAGAQVDHEVVRLDARHLEHARDHRVGRRQPHDVLAVLPQLRLIELVAIAREVLRERAGAHRQDHQPSRETSAV